MWGYLSWEAGLLSTDAGHLDSLISRGNLGASGGFCIMPNILIKSAAKQLSCQLYFAVQDLRGRRCDSSQRNSNTVRSSGVDSELCLCVISIGSSTSNRNLSTNNAIMPTLTCCT